MKAFAPYYSAIPGNEAAIGLLIKDIPTQMLDALAAAKEKVFVRGETAREKSVGDAGTSASDLQSNEDRDSSIGALEARLLQERIAYDESQGLVGTLFSLSANANSRTRLFAATMALIADDAKSYGLLKEHFRQRYCDALVITENRSFASGLGQMLTEAKEKLTSIRTEAADLIGDPSPNFEKDMSSMFRHYEARLEARGEPEKMPMLRKLAEKADESLMGIAQKIAKLVNDYADSLRQSNIEPMPIIVFSLKSAVRCDESLFDPLRQMINTNGTDLEAALPFLVAIKYGRVIRNLGTRLDLSVEIRKD